MAKPMIRLFNCETQETIDREMNDDEYASHLARIENDKKEVLDKAKVSEAKASALAKLAALGLTADEVAAIVGN